MKEERKDSRFIISLTLQRLTLVFITKYHFKLQYFGHLMRRVDSVEKTLMLGGIGAGGEGDDRGRDGWMASLTRWM